MTTDRFERLSPGVLIGLSLLGFFVMVIGAIVIDYRYWWLGYLVIPVSSYTIISYKPYLSAYLLRCERTRYMLGLTCLSALCFILSALFITLWWLIAIIPWFILMGTWGEFTPDRIIPVQSKREKRALFMMMGIFTALLIGLFSIPSYIANNHQNPKAHFSITYQAIESYSLYETTLPRSQEHVIPQSWYQNPNHFVNDPINVIYANAFANQTRQNKPFGQVKKTEANKVYQDTILVGYQNDQYFMPLDAYKGDVARIVIYMGVTYQNNGLKLDQIDLNLMKKWARQDPVDKQEKIRNKTIQSQYGFDNKFVSHPWLIGFVISI
ncbi:endonuclease [Methanobacterium sp. YSL]|nr:endonuclease [Methanobacterium sp. YSL]